MVVFFFLGDTLRALGLGRVKGHGNRRGTEAGLAAARGSHGIQQPLQHRDAMSAELLLG